MEWGNQGDESGEELEGFRAVLESKILYVINIRGRGALRVNVTLSKTGH